MATKNRFRGGLLAVPEPLPEDDDEATGPAQGVEPLVARTAAAPESSPDMINIRTEEPPRANASAPHEERRPPGTIRLNERAGGELWDAYVQAKTADPFLSYRQFASNVILDGIGAHKARQQH